VKLFAVLLALAAVVAAWLYPFSWIKQRPPFPALSHPAAQSGVSALRSACPAPLYQRVRNISSLDFYELQVDGIDFGPLRAGAETEYRQAPRCDGVAAIRVTSSQGAAAAVPYDLIGEAPTEPGYYTRALSLAPNNSVTSQLTKDAPAN
jgi:hypothetical protein